MSLDKLFHQILLTEQQLSEQTLKLKEVKAAIIRCHAQVKAATEKNQQTFEELDMKAQQMSAMTLERDWMNKCEEHMSEHIEELLCQKSHLNERLAKTRTQFQDEEQVFLQEISSFNSEYSLGGSRETVLASQTHTEVLNLDREVDSLHKEMEEMRQRNSHMSALHGEKRTHQLELQALKSMHADVEQQLSEAEKTTEALRAECHLVSQKPLTDSDCVRMREELALHKKGEMERLREALSSELQLLQSVRACMRRAQ
ncbi:coiled-coil domain-containing protein 172 isoform X2 [Dunckerocampus dactyliophorus]|uniref:coiled-coil domain-containing protein 172 isoform X2 n=1 Tax=Dunckerocampus dactyliophorus TaxID=161453 RepID=UPI0024060A9A|nr:coiled-coil domain-containing protein 172 isoform X2 [Dunckerocampus dactyliophorus]